MSPSFRLFSSQGLLRDPWTVEIIPEKTVSGGQPSSNKFWSKVNDWPFLVLWRIATIVFSQIQTCNLDSDLSKVARIWEQVANRAYFSQSCWVKSQVACFLLTGWSPLNSWNENACTQKYYQNFAKSSRHFHNQNLTVSEVYLKPVT